MTTLRLGQSLMLTSSKPVRVPRFRYGQSLQDSLDDNGRNGVLLLDHSTYRAQISV
jgi:hypothetical protein